MGNCCGQISYAPNDVVVHAEGCCVQSFSGASCDPRLIGAGVEPHDYAAKMQEANKKQSNLCKVILAVIIVPTVIGSVRAAPKLQLGHQSGMDLPSVSRKRWGRSRA